MGSHREGVDEADVLTSQQKTIFEGVCLSFILPFSSWCFYSYPVCFIATLGESKREDLIRANSERCGMENLSGRQSQPGAKEDGVWRGCAGQGKDNDAMTKLVEGCQEYESGRQVSVTIVKDFKFVCHMEHQWCH